MVLCRSAFPRGWRIPSSSRSEHVGRSQRYGSARGARAIGRVAGGATSPARGGGGCCQVRERRSSCGASRRRDARRRSLGHYGRARRTEMIRCAWRSRGDQSAAGGFRRKENRDQPVDELASDLRVLIGRSRIEHPFLGGFERLFERDETTLRRFTPIAKMRAERARLALDGGEGSCPSHVPADGSYELCYRRVVLQ